MVQKLAAPMAVPFWFFALLVSCRADPFDGENIPLTTQPAVETAGQGHSDQAITRTLVWGAQLPSTNGVLFNADDQLYVTSVVDRSIRQIDPRSGQVLAILGPDNGVEGPDDLAFGGDGSLYWTGFLTGEVGRLAPDGSTSTVAQLGPGANAITFSAAGRLFVSRVFLADELWEVDPNGDAPPRLVAEALGGFNGMDFGPGGFLYGPLWFRGEIARVDVDSGEVTVVAGDFDTPAAVKFDSRGRLHVVDQHRGQVLRLDLQRGERSVVAQVGVGADNLAFDSRDRLFVTNAHEGSILRVFPWGWAWPITRPGSSAPGGVALQAVAGRWSLFFSDIYTLREVAPWSGWPRSVAHSVVGGITALNTPFSVGAYGANLVTTSWFANAVQIWNPVLKDVVADHRDFAVPLNAIGFGDDLVVAELGSGCVMRRPAGTSERLPMACDLYVPAGLASRGGDLWVSDWATGSVWQIATLGEKLDPPLLVASGLSQPEGLAVTPTDSLLVVEAGAGRLSAIDLYSGVRTTIISDLDLGKGGVPGYPPTWIFNGVAVDECGVIYLPVDNERRVLRLTKNGRRGCGAVL